MALATMFFSILTLTFMSDDRNQTDGDLFDTEGSESSTDAASTTETENEELDLGEESENEKPSVKAKAVAPGEAQRQKMVEAWALKVTDGEADLDDLPPKQKWMKPLIEQRLGLQKKVDELDQTTEQIIVRKLAEKEEAKRFDELKKLAKDLSSSQKAQIKSEYQDLRSQGLNPSKALETAYKIAQIESEDETTILRKRMAIPEVGDGKTFFGAPIPNDELPAKEEDRMKLYAEMAKGR